MSLLARWLPPKTLPEPDPLCRSYTFPEMVLLMRNHEDQFRMSKSLHEEEYAAEQSEVKPIYHYADRRGF